MQTLRLTLFRLPNYVKEKKSYAKKKLCKKIDLAFYAKKRKSYAKKLKVIEKDIISHKIAFLLRFAAAFLLQSGGYIQFCSAFLLHFFAANRVAT
jgi:hypothetical protein